MVISKLCSVSGNEMGYLSSDGNNGLNINNDVNNDNNNNNLANINTIASSNVIVNANTNNANVVNIVPPG